MKFIDRYILPLLLIVVGAFALIFGLVALIKNIKNRKRDQEIQKGKEILDDYYQAIGRNEL
jgi:uncharacterized membrane protein HdeD (DUF308 family)